jgi:hypothetical protein
MILDIVGDLVTYSRQLKHLVFDERSASFSVREDHGLTDKLSTLISPARPETLQASPSCLAENGSPNLLAMKSWGGSTGP